MFADCRSFNTPLVWNTTNVVDTGEMFRNATSFNQPVNFVTDNVIMMSYMFAGARAFNSTVTFSSTARVKAMERMFSGSAFNQRLNFNTESMERVDNMFANAPFEQDVSKWNVSKVTLCAGFCNACALPNFTQCDNDCIRKTSVRGWSVCNCPKGEVNVSATQCEFLPPTMAPNTSVISQVPSIAPCMTCIIVVNSVSGNASQTVIVGDNSSLVSVTVPPSLFRFPQLHCAHYCRAFLFRPPYPSGARRECDCIN